MGLYLTHECIFVCFLFLNPLTWTTSSLSVCVSLTSDSSETVEVIVIKLGTVTASDTRRHHVLIILTLIFIQDHTDLNHEHNEYLIISEAIHAMPIKCAVKIVRLKVYLTIARLSFKVTSASQICLLFNLQYLGQYFKLLHLGFA